MEKLEDPPLEKQEKTGDASLNKNALQFVRSHVWSLHIACCGVHSTMVFSTLHCLQDLICCGCAMTALKLVQAGIALVLETYTVV